MGFLSADYKTKLEENIKKNSSTAPGQGIKPNDIVDTVGRAVGGSVAKLANEAYQEGKQVVGTTKMAAANTTGNSKAFKNANIQSQKDYKGFKSSGGLFNAGTITNEAETKQGALATGARKIGANTIGTAAEVLPFARGATLAKAGGSLLPNLTRSTLEGAGYNLTGGVAQQLGEGKANFDQLVTNALIGGATGGVGFGIGKSIGRGLNKVLPGEVSVIGTHATLPKRINVTDVSSPEVSGKITAGLPNSPRPTYTPIKNAPHTDTEFRLRFNDSAKKALKDIPSVADQYLKTGDRDPVNLIVSHLAGNNTGENIPKLISKLIPGIEKPAKTALTKSLAQAKDSSAVKDLLYTASENTNNKLAVGDQVIAPTRNISFVGDEQSKKFSAALIGGPKTTTANVPKGSSLEGHSLDAEGNYISGPLKGQPPLTIHTDTNLTTPEQAKGAIALEATAPSSAVSQEVTPLKRAQAALVGETSIEEPGTEVGKGAESIARHLDKQLSTFDSNLAVPESLLGKLNNSEAVTRKARKNDWLNHYEDTLSVMGRNFGKIGTDSAYKLAEGAKMVADIQEATRPSIDKTQKILKSMSKSKTGRAEIQSHIYSALEDRANADQYLVNDKEKQLFQEAAKVLDFFKQERDVRGKSVVGEDYSPRTVMRSALEAPDRLFENARSAFPRDAQSNFSKQRVADIPDADINKNIIDLLPRYVSSQAKEFGYEGAIKFIKENLPNVHPVNVIDAESTRQSYKYLQTLLSDVLDPPTMSKFEKFQNKLISNTYKAQLGFSPKFAFQNMTQRFATKSVVSNEAVKLSKQIDKSDIDALRKEMTSGSNPITGEISNTPDGIAAKHGIFERFDPGTRVERGNVIGAFDKGAAQGIVNSDIYKAAIKQGLKPADAAKQALGDPATRELAIRHGNVVVNDTQFGANFVLKPEFFRKSGTFFGLSDKWFKQYQRFPQGMIQNLSTIIRSKDAQALDILKRGNPAETQLVDYKYSAQAMQNGVNDIIKGIKNGEISDVPLEVATGYKASLDKATTELDKQIKAHSQVRGGKTAKSAVKMWAAASAIQFLFDGGLAMNETDKTKEIRKSIQYGSPVNIPTRDQNPLTGVPIPSSPIRPNGQFQARRLANFVPVVGPIVNRGADIQKFVKALSGNSQ